MKKAKTHLSEGSCKRVASEVTRKAKTFQLGNSTTGATLIKLADRRVVESVA